MTLDIGNTDRLNIFRQEAQRLGVKVLPPDINRSEAVFACDAEKGVIYLRARRREGRRPPGDGSCRGRARAERPVPQSSRDFARRIDPKLVNKRAFESLARAGAFDALQPNRRQMVESVRHPAQQRRSATRASARAGRRRCSAARRDAREDVRLAAVADWPAHERLSEEFSAMGFYLSGHPLDAYAARAQATRRGDLSPRCSRIAAAPASRRCSPAP